MLYKTKEMGRLKNEKSLKTFKIDDHFDAQNNYSTNCYRSQTNQIVVILTQDKHLLNYSFVFST